MDQRLIRNFSIIAHIDHGKSTLADRILQLTHAISDRDMRSQVLDSMDLERERGITIKAQAVRVPYTARDGQTYQLNLIDTPGHVDFSYEVSRSLAACEGALLVVDASQGIEAQTLANTYLAIEGDLEIVPVLNKIDLPAADPDRHGRAVADLIGEDPDRVLRISAKSGEGVPEVLEAIVQRVPPPAGDPDAPARALIFDSVYDQYRGVVTFVRVVDGAFREGDRLRAMQTGLDVEAEEIGVMTPSMVRTGRLGVGESGYLITGLKHLGDLRVGDTLTTAQRPAPDPLPGYREVKPVVFCGLFPVDSDDYPALRDALGRLSLNDASLVWEPETSRALGFGYRCGFLGLLHMDIVRERLEREYDLELLATTPNVEYRVTTTAGETHAVRSPAELPPTTQIERIEEPFVRCTVLVPQDGVGAVMGLCQDRRGVFVTMEPIEQRQQIVYDLPLAEIVLDFYDQLKSRTRGYASLDYELVGLRESPLVKLDILLNGEPVDALSAIVHGDTAYARGRTLVERLQKTIPRQLFDVPIQAAIGAKIIARETVKAKRKDVLAKCYGGDISRKRKLLERQKEGKKRMKQVGSVEVPQEAFLAVLQIGDNGDGGQAVNAGVRHLYLHLPFCGSRCGYCAFVVETDGWDRRDAYLDALLAELALEGGRIGLLDTLYMGGGTPTLMRARRLAALMDRVRERLAPGAEVTIEANPETVAGPMLRDLRRMGVTRLSLGVQSFQPHLLAALDRQATADQARRAYRCARAAGFEDVSVDLLFGVPGQTEADLEADLAEVVDLAPDHVSWYELELKPGSALARRPGLVLDEGFAEEAYPRVVEGLEAAGYRWYETANFARPGRECRHSLAYWGAADYLGLGVGAVSTVGGRRWRNAAGTANYAAALRRGEAPPRTEEALDAATVRRERWMLGTRLARPLDLAWAGPPDRPEALDRLGALGLVRADGAALELTRRGRFLQNAVLHELIEFV